MRHHGFPPAPLSLGPDADPLFLPYHGILNRLHKEHSTKMRWYDRSFLIAALSMSVSLRFAFMPSQMLIWCGKGGHGDSSGCDTNIL